MTEDWTTVEAIARKYCRKIGLDPDELVPVPMPDYLTAHLGHNERNAAIMAWKPDMKPRWRLCIGDVRRELMDRAMKASVDEILAQRRV